MMRRKFFSVARKEAAAQRWTIAASRQRHTRRVRRRTPDCGLSIKLVVARQRCNDGGMPKRLMVKHSSNPSRKLLAAAGDSCSSQSASLRNRAVPLFSPQFVAGAHGRFYLILLFLRQAVAHVADLVIAETLYRMLRSEDSVNRSSHALVPWITNKQLGLRVQPTRH